MDRSTLVKQLMRAAESGNVALLHELFHEDANERIVATSVQILLLYRRSRYDIYRHHIINFYPIDG